MFNAWFWINNQGIYSFTLGFIYYRLIVSTSLVQTRILVAEQIFDSASEIIVVNTLLDTAIFTFRSAMTIPLLMLMPMIALLVYLSE